MGIESSQFFGLRFCGNPNPMALDTIDANLVWSSADILARHLLSAHWFGRGVDTELDATIRRFLGERQIKI